MNEYLKNLILQFAQATGVENVDIHSESFINEFTSWIFERKKIVPNYQEFITYLSKNPCIGASSVEIGKGEFDSIAIDSEVSIITPYTEGVKKTKGSLIKGNFLVVEEMPLIEVEEKGKIEVYSVNDVYRFITQNPYTQKELVNWENLHNSGRCITVGVYGKVYDKDIESKIKLMEELKSKLFSGYVSEYNTERDNYMYVVSSNAIKKELVKEKTIECVRTKSKCHRR